MSRMMTLGLYRVNDDFVVVPVNEGDEARLEFVFASIDLVVDYMRIAGASQRSRTLDMVASYEAARVIAGSRLDDSIESVIFEVDAETYAVATIIGGGEYSGYDLPLITDLRENADEIVFSNGYDAWVPDLARVLTVRADR